MDLKSAVLCHWLMYFFSKTFRLTLKPSSVEKTRVMATWLQADFWVCIGFTNQSCVSRPRIGSSQETAITTALHPPKWWFRYVDDSRAYLKKDHQLLNSINANIQFTLELENTNGHGFPFLDTITFRRGTAVQVGVYRRPTHTGRYLDFLSYYPSCHKRSMVNTLLLRARNIPSTSKGKREETRREWTYQRHQLLVKN